MKLIIFSTILVIILVFFLPAILSLGIKYIPSGNQPSLSSLQKIHDDLIIYQPFMATNENLSIIAMTIKNPNLENKKDIVLTLFDSNNVVIRTAILSGKNIRDGDFIKFKFEPIKDSRNKNYTFTISAPQSDQNEAMEVFLTKDKVSGIDQLMIYKTKMDSAVAFVSYYKVSNVFYPMKLIYISWINKLVSDFYFFIIYIGILFSILGILFLNFKTHKKIIN